MELQNKPYSYLFLYLLLNTYSSPMPLCAHSEQSNITILLTIHSGLTCFAKHITKMMSFAWVTTDMGFGDSKERKDSKLNEAPNETLALLTSGTEPQKSLAGLSQKHRLLENNNQEREPSQSSNPQQMHTHTFAGWNEGRWKSLHYFFYLLKFLTPPQTLPIGIFSTKESRQFSALVDMIIK